MQYSSFIVLSVLLVFVGNCAARPKCSSLSDCQDGEFCLSPTGMCSSEGYCQSIPKSCGTDITYVCGCDGKSYPNACFAYARNVSIYEDEGCADVKVCTSNDDCSEVPSSRPQYCQLPNGQCSGRGRCADVPDVCNYVVGEVCGCDSNTYTNDCFAAQSGVNVRNRERCKNQECKKAEDCHGENQYCEYPAGQCQGVGECIGRPLFCNNNYDPVCGCDGRLYGNACYAATDGASVYAKGPCKHN